MLSANCKVASANCLEAKRALACLEVESKCHSLESCRMSIGSTGDGSTKVALTLAPKLPLMFGDPIAIAKAGSIRRSADATCGAETRGTAVLCVSKGKNQWDCFFRRIDTTFLSLQKPPFSSHISALGTRDSAPGASQLERICLIPLHDSTARELAAKALRTKLLIHTNRYSDLETEPRSTPIGQFAERCRRLPSADCPCKKSNGVLLLLV
jgi:hypothetical protein